MGLEELLGAVAEAAQAPLATVGAPVEIAWEGPAHEISWWLAPVGDGRWAVLDDAEVDADRVDLYPDRDTALAQARAAFRRIALARIQHAIQHGDTPATCPVCGTGMALVGVDAEDNLRWRPPCDHVDRAFSGDLWLLAEDAGFGHWRGA